MTVKKSNLIVKCILLLVYQRAQPERIGCNLQINCSFNVDDDCHNGITDSKSYVEKLNGVDLQSMLTFIVRQLFISVHVIQLQ